MKIRKILAAAAAAAVALSAAAVNVFAADEYTAKLGFADTAWGCSGLGVLCCRNGRRTVYP